MGHVSIRLTHAELTDQGMGLEIAGMAVVRVEVRAEALAGGGGADVRDVVSTELDARDLRIGSLAVS